MGRLNKTQFKLIAQQAWKARKERMDIEKTEKSLFDQLKQMANGEGVEAGGFVFNYTIREGSINYSIIPELKSIDLSQYKKEPIQVWKLEKA